MRRALFISAALLTVGAGPARADGSSSTAYGLDTLPRDTPTDGRLPCPEVDLETYAGTSVHYRSKVKIYPGFEPSLRAFEEIVRDTAVEVYGRAPRTLIHDGTYVCRRIRNIATLLSEHALGNAIDVAGFDFDAAPRGTDAPAGLHGAFTVTLDRHWNGTAGTAGVHARFLHLLAERVIAAQTFRVVLGPSYPGHEGHFHLDNAPYRLVHVFGYDPSHSTPL